jgi:hypothetical protein
LTIVISREQNVHGTAKFVPVFNSCATKMLVNVYTFRTSAIDRGGWSALQYGFFCPGGKSHIYPLDDSLCGTQSRSGHSCGEVPHLGSEPMLSDLHHVFLLSKLSPTFLRGGRNEPYKNQAWKLQWKLCRQRLRKLLLGSLNSPALKFYIPYAILYNHMNNGSVEAKIRTIWDCF